MLETVKQTADDVQNSAVYKQVLMAVWFSTGFLRKVGYLSMFYLFEFLPKVRKEYDILTDFGIFPLTQVQQLSIGSKHFRFYPLKMIL